MKNRDVLTRSLAVVGTVLVWIPILAPILFSVVFLITAKALRFDYLMPAELFLLVLRKFAHLGHHSSTLLSEHDWMGFGNCRVPAGGRPSAGRGDGVGIGRNSTGWLEIGLGPCLISWILTCTDRHGHRWFAIDSQTIQRV